jgi:hypothetical protein
MFKVSEAVVSFSRGAGQSQLRVSTIDDLSESPPGSKRVADSSCVESGLGLEGVDYNHRNREPEVDLQMRHSWTGRLTALQDSSENCIPRSLC